ncbi:IgA FC receptor [Labeo rohita]|uniref:IgA FC receptor n=1 Tax=Labeo rohita TaxID=84645 RepID=A0ABQ8LYQ4_LABRO|nr:IgA FC receptor [Labeo rohita]
MDHPAFRLLLLEQGNRSLEDHTKDFMFLAPMTHYPDSSLCSFYRTGLNPTTRAQLSGDGPRESLATYVEWVLGSSRSSRTVEDDTSTTPDPEQSPATPQLAEPEPEPTVDGEPEPNVTEQPNVGSPRVCQSPSASWLEDPSSSPLASESWTPPRPSDPAAPPRHLAPPAPGPFCLLFGSSLRRIHPGLCSSSSRMSVLRRSLLLQ